MSSNDPASITDALRQDHKAEVQAQFGAAAAGYVASTTHAEGDDLARLVDWAEGGADRVALDVATGGGHTALALAPFYGRVVATDLTEPMLRAAESLARDRGVANVEFRRADAEHLPFADGSFDVVSCRIAPHHFDDVGQFIREAARVLRPGGLLLLEDSVAPADSEAAAFLNRVETLRDSTHVLTLARRDWLELISNSGLTVEADAVIAKAHPFRAWVDRANASAEAKSALDAAFQGASPSVQAALQIVVDGSSVASYTDEKLLVKARRSDR